MHIYLPAGSYPDDRTRDQKRVDALADILADNVHLHINVDVVIPADTLAGLQDAGASIDGYGPVAGQHARALALHTETGEQLVVYQSEQDGQVYASPVVMFMEWIEHQGQVVSRFTPVA